MRATVRAPTEPVAPVDQGLVVAFASAALPGTCSSGVTGSAFSVAGAADY